MKFPVILRRLNRRVHKNDFGHVLIVAGSRPLLGAGALCSLAALRCGAGLVTLGVPESLNETAQKKISPAIMTWPLPETKEKTVGESAFRKIQKKFSSFQALAIGPGLSGNTETKKFILKIIARSSVPLIIDADALNALSEDLTPLYQNRGVKILTPHPGEMSRLTGLKKSVIEARREEVAQKFAREFHCCLLLKGDRTVVASPDGKVYVNKTGNAGMATAGSGDVLTGMIAAFLAQGLEDFEAARWGAYLHGLAGDTAAKKIPKASLTATDIIEAIPRAIRHAHR